MNCFPFICKRLAPRFDAQRKTSFRIIMYLLKEEEMSVFRRCFPPQTTQDMAGIQQQKTLYHYKADKRDEKNASAQARFLIPMTWATAGRVEHAMNTYI